MVTPESRRNPKARDRFADVVTLQTKTSWSWNALESLNMTRNVHSDAPDTRNLKPERAGRVRERGDGADPYQEIYLTECIY